MRHKPYPKMGSIRTAGHVKQCWANFSSHVACASLALMGTWWNDKSCLGDSNRLATCNMCTVFHLRNEHIQVYVSVMVL